MTNLGNRSISARARLLKWIVYVAMGIMVASQLLYALAPPLGLIEARIPSGYERLPPLAGLLLRGCAAAAWLLSFWFLSRMLKPLEDGAFFTGSLTRNLRAFAGWLVLALGIPGLAVPIVRVVTVACPTEPCLRPFEIDLRTLFLMIIAILLFLVARLLDEARRIEDEHKQIV